MIQSILYDKESEVLSIELKKGKSVDSEMQGNVVIDYDQKGEIVRINFYNFNFDLFREKQRVLKDFIQRSQGSLAIR